MQIGRISQGRYVWRGNVKVYFLFIEEEYEGMFFYILNIYIKKCINCRNLIYVHI